MDKSTICIGLDCLCAYHPLMEQPLMQALASLLRSEEGHAALGHYTQTYALLRESGHAGLGTWLEEHLLYDSAPYPNMVAAGGTDAGLTACAREEVALLQAVAGLDGDALLADIAAALPREYEQQVLRLPRWERQVPFSFDSLSAAYERAGTGLFARYRAFLWQEGELQPITHPDLPRQEDLVGYTYQRQALIANTRGMLEGKPVNNALLYGDSGTGKSATVKSLLTVEGFDNLRLVELQKEHLGGIPQLIRRLRHQRQKFVLFIDDLAFDKDDNTYSLLKTILEGTLEQRPQNVVIYATSNRRQLVKQTFSDRTGDEVDVAETIQEKTALSDRFGLRLIYQPLNKGDYLALVDELARQKGISLAEEELHRLAMQWELRSPGRTPRTVQQFLAALTVKEKGV